MSDNATSPPAVTSVLPALTDKSAKAAKPGDVLYDADIKGLHLRVFPETRAYYLYFRNKAGQQRRPKIGTFGQITLAQARKVAQEMLTEVAAGRDPSQQRQDARAEPTVADLWAQYWKRHGSHKKSGSEDERMWNAYLVGRFGRRKLSSMQYTDVADMMDEMKATPMQANRCLALLSKMFNFAHRPLEWSDKNPCKGVRRYPETKRKRYMTGEEPARIAEQLEKEAIANPQSVAFIYLLILTGARSSEIANAQWDWLQGSVLHLPDSKTGAKPVFIAPAAMEVIARLPRTSGTITGIRSPKKLWDKVRKAAGCPDLRLHDLRHSFASAALAAGLSLSQIGELLGHKSAQTTKRYAHLVEEAAVSASTMAADRIMLSMKKPTKEIV